MLVMDHSLDTNVTSSRVTELQAALTDMLRVGAAINNVTSRVAVTNKDNSAEMARIKDVYRVVAERDAQTRASFADSERLLNDSLHLLNQTVLNNNVSVAFDT